MPHEPFMGRHGSDVRLPQLLHFAAFATRWAVTNGPRGTGRILPPLVRRLHTPQSNATSVQAIVEVSPGLVVNVDTASTYERDLYFLGSRFYEPEVRSLLPRLIRRGHSALDIGANIGIHAIVMAIASNGGTVLAVEPVAANVDRLRANIQINGLRNIIVVEAAASDRPGTIEIHVPATGSASQPYASVVANVEFLSGSRPIEVRAASVDELVAEYQVRDIDLIKVDVEGFEPAVLKGAWSTLGDQHPVLIVEHVQAWWSNAGFDEDELRRDLRSIGYEDVFLLYRRRTPSLIPVRSPLPDGNLLIVPRGRRLSINLGPIHGAAR